jgi:acyl-CoA oxidase
VISRLHDVVWAGMDSVRSPGSEDCMVSICRVLRTSIITRSLLLRLDASYRCRFEGDNFVLDHQVVRAALKAHSALASLRTANNMNTGNHLTPMTRFLRHLVTPPDTSSSSLNWTDPKTLVELLERRAACVVDAYAILVSSGKEGEDAGASRRISGAVTSAFVGAQVLEMIRSLDDKDGLGVKDKEILKKLYTLVLSDSNHFC